MKRAMVLSLSFMLVAATLCSVPALAQEPEYTLKDYMPYTVGSKWMMKSVGGDGDQTSTYEVLEARNVGGQQALPIVMKTAEGQIRFGTLELVTADKLTIFGSLFRRGGDQGGQTTTVRYEPAASFPGKMRAGQSEEAALKVNIGQRQMDVTIKLELAAVEAVTVPKGTFEDCLKLVYTTSFGRGEMKRTVWYAKGVGMVKTERTGRGGQGTRVAELTDYSLVK
ncbi:MAG: hypothetical protein ACE5R4_13010 [Armatimonadota bacterium]